MKIASLVYYSPHTHTRTHNEVWNNGNGHCRQYRRTALNALLCTERTGPCPAFCAGPGQATRSGLAFDTEGADTNRDTEMGLAPERRHQSTLGTAVSPGRRAVCPEGRSLAALRHRCRRKGERQFVTVKSRRTVWYGLPTKRDAQRNANV